MKKETFIIVVTKASYFFSHRLTLAKEASKKYKIVVLCDAKNYENKFIEENIDFIHLPFQRDFSNIINEIQTIYKITRVFWNLKPKQVHLVSLKPILYGSLSLRISPAKNSVNAYTGLGHLFISKTKKAKFMKNILIFGLKLWAQGKNIKNLVQNEDDFFLIKNLLKKSQCIKQPGVGVDLSNFRKITDKKYKHFSNENPMKVLLPARMLKTKGVDVFIESAKKAKNIPVEFILAGPYDPCNPDHIKLSELENFQTLNNCTWLGNKNNMVDLYNNCDLVVLLSHREGCPKSLLEAMSCGKAIITTNVPGCIDLLCKDRKNVMIINHESTLEFIDALNYFLKKPSELNRMGTENASIAKKKYDSLKIAKETIEMHEI